MMSAEGRSKQSWVRRLLPLLLLSLATAYPTSMPDALPTIATDVTCTTLEQMCWSRGLVQSPVGDVSTFGTASPEACSSLLSSGACAEGEWVVLDLDAQDASFARCARRPCPFNQVLWDGICMAEREASVAHCGGGILHHDPTGVARCGYSPGWAHYFPKFMTCKLQPTKQPDFQPTTVVFVPANKCAQSDRGGCVKDVKGPTGAVVIKSEDD